MAPTDQNQDDWAHHSAFVRDRLERLQEAVDALRAMQDEDRKESAAQRTANAVAIHEVRSRIDTEIKVLYAKAIGFGTAIGIVVSTVLPLIQKYL